MNERIKQLKHEAYQFANSNCGDEFGGVDEMKRRLKFEEKFAELIVQECASLFDPDLRDEHEEWVIRKSILNHFGVEE